MSKNSINILIILILLCILVILPSVAYASNGTFDASTYQPSSTTDAQNSINNLGQGVIKIISTVGTIISVVFLIILGIKYMTGSVEEKAEYKKTMLPYVIGAVILFGITSFIGIIVDLVKGLI